MNIVLLVIDTLRAKNLPFYGYEKNTAPFLEELSQEGELIERYYSNSPWTVPAHATIFTGDLPSEHGTTTEKTYFAEDNSLIEGLKEEGFTTYGISENGLVSNVLGFGEDFDFFKSGVPAFFGGKTWEEVWEKDSEFENRIQKYSYFVKRAILTKDIDSIISLGKYIKREYFDRNFFNASFSDTALDFASTILGRDEDSFVFINLMSVHAPYTFTSKQKEEFLGNEDREVIERLTSFDTLSDYLDLEEKINDREFEIRENAYNASIKYTDEIIKDFVENSSDTVFFIVGDHGELIGEYEKYGSRLVDHHFGTFKELVEVPLIIYPRQEFSKKGDVFDHRDLHDMILSVSGKDKEVGRDRTYSEYFGKAGFNKQFGEEIPKDYEFLFKRKSFSLITSEIKYDLASDGNFIWDSGSSTEQTRLDKEFLSDNLSKEAEDKYREELE